MQNARDALTPDALAMLQTIASAGSFAAAARALGMVPSALSYRVRQIEEAMDVLLYDRSSRQARLTEAGAELLREGRRLLDDLDAVANRVKRVATGWEPQLTLAVDSIIAKPAVMELCAHFRALHPPTRIKLRDETLSGTLEALTSGQADLAIGVAEVHLQDGHNHGQHQAR
jgi:DNA-binding transcriptional LysR family regulator